MEKRFFSSVLSFLLLISTTGVGLHIHICSQEGVLLSFFNTPKCICSELTEAEECSADKSCCSLPNSSEEENSEEKSCCTDDFLLISQDTEQLRNQQLLSSPNPFDHFNFTILPTELIQNHQLSSIQYYHPSKSPPNIINRYLVFCSLLC